MTGVFNAKKLVTWHAIAPTYSATTVITTDMLPWIAQIKYCHRAHQPATGLTTMTGVGDPPPDITVTPDTHAMTTETDLDSVALDPTPVTTAIGVVARQDPHRSHSRSFHRSSHCNFSCDRSSSSYHCHHNTPHRRPSSHRNTSRDDSRS